MVISQRCRLFIFAIVIGMAALLLPIVASAHVSILTCGKTSFRLDEVAETVAHRGPDGGWGERFPLRVSLDAFRWEVKSASDPRFTDYYFIDRRNLEFNYRRCGGNDCAGRETICSRQSNHRHH